MDQDFRIMKISYGGLILNSILTKNVQIVSS